MFTSLYSTVFGQYLYSIINNARGRASGKITPAKSL